MELPSLPIVIVGHVDHGKSTLIGRLLSDTGFLKEQRQQEIADSSSLLGKDVEYAFAMDALEEEREGGLTIDTTQAYFQTNKRRYTLVDAPGHKEFLRNMITGASYALAAILVIDVNEGVMEQTRRHAFLLNMAGIKHVVVALNKMDLVSYKQGIFEDVKQQIKAYFLNMSLYPTHYIPISAKTGLNLVHNNNSIPWYDGPSLLEALDALEVPGPLQAAVRFPVQDVYEMEGKRILVGRVESGEIRRDMELHILPVALKDAGNAKCRVSRIMKFMQDDLLSAAYGASVGLIVYPEGNNETGRMIQRGHVLAGDPTARTTGEFEARIFWFDENYKKDIITIKHTTRTITASMTIHSKVDPAFIDRIIYAPADIAIGEVAHVTISTDEPVVIDSFSEINEMGRFVIESNNVPVACGIIL